MKENNVNNEKRKIYGEWENEAEKLAENFMFQ